MINTNKLKGLIVERGTTQQAVADSIGIDRSTFYRKMKKGGDFSIEEAKKMKQEIPLTDQEAIEIFLAEKSHLRYKTNNIRRRRQNENTKI